MRDPNRIPLILKALEEAWRQDPDLRLGQLLVTSANLGGLKVVCPELFYPEDEVILKGILTYRDRMKEDKARRAENIK